MSRFLPLVVFVAMVALFAIMLTSDRDPRELQSALVGHPVPAFELPGLTVADDRLTTVGLTGDEPIIVNFFASWCVPCRAEHESLMQLAQGQNVTMVGIAYKDEVEDAKAFLAELGDPFDQRAYDLSGRTAIEWGVSGVPETFIIAPGGRVSYRHFGPIIGDSLTAKLLPQLEAVR